MKLSRNKLFLLSLIIILIYYLINRVTFLINSAEADGVVIPLYEYPEWNSSMIGSPIVSFAHADTTIKFIGTQYLFYRTGTHVPVVYNINKPDDAYIFSFFGFWYIGLIWCVWPTMFVGAFIFGFIKRNQYLEISLKYPVFRRKQMSSLPEKFE